MINADPEPERDWGAVAAAGCLIVLILLVMIVTLVGTAAALHLGWNLVR